MLREIRGGQIQYSMNIHGTSQRRAIEMRRADDTLKYTALWKTRELATCCGMLLQYWTKHIELNYDQRRVVKHTELII